MRIDKSQKMEILAVSAGGMDPGTSSPSQKQSTGAPEQGSCSQGLVGRAVTAGGSHQGILEGFGWKGPSSSSVPQRGQGHLPGCAASLASCSRASIPPPEPSGHCCPSPWAPSNCLESKKDLKPSTPTNLHFCPMGTRSWGIKSFPGKSSSGGRGQEKSY